MLDHAFYTIERVEHLLALCSQIMYVDEEIFPLLSEAKLLVGHCNQLQETREMCFHSEKTHDGNRGRPRYAITAQQLQYFIHFGFKAPEIASMLGVSESTLRRRLKDFNLSTSQRFTEISDEELDNVVKHIKQEFNNSGYRMIIGLLRGRGLQIPQRRVIECLRQVDIEGVIVRTLQLGIIYRRKYCVYGPNALWHIDTNHKLIRYSKAVF